MQGAVTVASAAPVVSPRSITIVVPGIPRGKGRPRFVRATGRAYTPAATESYEAVIRHLAALEMQGQEPMTGPLKMRMRAVFPIPSSWSKRKTEAAIRGEIRPTSKPDVDNLIKLADALNAIVFRDDAQVWSVEAEKVYGLNPALVLTVVEAA